MPSSTPGMPSGERRCCEHGITLYELRRLSSDDCQAKARGRFGSSGSSLHAKTFSVDRSRVFVGSFNFDPRSREAKYRNGVCHRQPGNWRRPSKSRWLPAFRLVTYEVRLTDAGQLQWIERSEEQLGAPRYGAWHECLAARSALGFVVVAGRVAIVTCRAQVRAQVGEPISVRAIVITSRYAQNVSTATTRGPNRHTP